MKPTDLTSHDGKTVNLLTKGLLLEMERHLGYDLSVMQGSYRPGSRWSANTHRGGGAFDLAPYDWARKVSVGRQLGAAIWHRTAIRGLWAEHCHGIVIGDASADPSAKAQVTDYFNWHDGLAGNGRDGSWHPNPIPTWTWAKAQASLAKPRWNQTPPPKPKAAEHLFVDYSFARLDPKAIKAAGYRGVVRYLAPLPNQKTLTLAEAKSIVTAGLWLMLVWETTAGRAGQGYAAGVADAKAANALADSLGAPRTVAIFYAVDFDASPGQVAPYFAGVNSVKARPTGTYGSARIIEAGFTPWLWQTEAWSHGGVSAKAHVLQRAGHHSHPIAGTADNQWDENVVLHGIVPVWQSGAAKPAPKPAPAKPAPMPTAVFWNGQFNSQQTDPAAQSTSQLKATIPRCAIWGLNEIGTTWQRATLAAIRGYSVWPLVGAAAADPIVWYAPWFDVVSKDVTIVHPGQAHITEQRQIVRVTFKHKATGKVFTRINTHVVHHIEAGGKPMVYHGAEIVAYAQQQARAKLHFAMLHDAIVKWSALGPVIAGGDFNVDYHADVKAKTPWFPNAVLSPVAVPLMPAGGTDGNRAIDWTLATKDVHELAQITLVQGYSDHRAVATKLSL